MSLRDSSREGGGGKHGRGGSFIEKLIHIERKSFLLGFFFFIIILILGFAFLPKIIFKSEAPIAQTVKFKTQLSDAQVLSITAKESIVKDFVARNPTYETKVLFLDIETLNTLSISSPAIYADLPKKDLYKVEYFAKGDEGVLLILDPETKEVLKYYRTKKLTL